MSSWLSRALRRISPHSRFTARACAAVVIGTLASSLLSGSAGTAATLASLDGCEALPQVFTVEQSSSIEVPFTKFPEPAAKPKPSPTPAPPPIGFPPGAKNVSGTMSFELNGELYVISITPTASPKEKKGQGQVGEMSVSPSPTPTPTPNIDIRGSSDRITAVVLEGHRARVVDSSSSPSPAASSASDKASSDASPGPFKVKITGLQPGVVHLLVSSGTTCSYALVNVVMKSGTRFVVSSGIGASTIPVSTYTAAPAIAGTIPGRLVLTEKSNGQLFLPILANYRVTDNAWPFNFYLSGGLATRGGSFRQLYGISIGNGDFFLTTGWHSDEINIVQNATGAAPIMFQQRTTRPFASLTFSLCNILQLLPGIASCPSPAASPSPSSSPSAATNTTSTSQ